MQTMSRIGHLKHPHWLFVAGYAAVLLLLYLAIGPLRQTSAYHQFVDVRVWCGVPRFGDVLSNGVILLSGLFAASLFAAARHDSPAGKTDRIFIVFIIGVVGTAVGSSFYHWAPSDARLVWDRLPMTLVLQASLALVIATRFGTALGEKFLYVLLPLGVLSVMWWAVRGDLLPYLVIRVGAGLCVIVVLLRGFAWRADRWFVVALALDPVLTWFEHHDSDVFWWTQQLVSGHTVKHVLAGVALACVCLWWREHAAIRMLGSTRPSADTPNKTPSPARLVA